VWSVRLGGCGHHGRALGVALTCPGVLYLVSVTAVRRCLASPRVESSDYFRWLTSICQSDSKVLGIPGVRPQAVSLCVL
jgi:hypothetical protein